MDQLTTKVANFQRTTLLYGRSMEVSVQLLPREARDSTRVLASVL